MSPTMIVLAVVIGSLLLAVLVVGVRRWTAPTGIVVHQTGPDTLRIRTPLGRGSARLVVHDWHGRVYEVTTDLRGEGGPKVSYVPPSAHVVRAHLAQRIDEVDMRRRRGVR